MRRWFGVIAIVGAVAAAAGVQAQVVKPLGTEFQVNTYTTNSGPPAVCGTQDGRFVVVWGGGEADRDDRVFGQRYASDGGAGGDEFQVNTYTTDEQESRSVLRRRGRLRRRVGGTPAGWERRRCLRPALRQQRRAARHRVPGEHLHPDNDQTSAAVCRAPSGDFVVTWDELRPGRRRLRRLRPALRQQRGAAQGTEFQVNTYTYDTQEYPAVACDGER